MQSTQRLNGEDEWAYENDRNSDEASREPRAQGHVGAGSVLVIKSTAKRKLRKDDAASRCPRRE
jgi:hypothetical protein